MDVGAIADALEQVPVFAALPVAERRELAAKLRLRRYAPNDIVFHRGDPAAHLYILVAGTLKVALPDEQGREAIISLLRGGDVFGEIALFDEGARSATVISITESECLLLQREDLMAVLARSTTALREMLRYLAKRVRSLSTHIEDLVFLDVPSRVAKSLLDLAELGGTEVPEIELTQDDVASIVGATRVSVNRVLASLEARGIVKVSRRRVEILDRGRLQSEVRYQ